MVKLLKLNKRTKEDLPFIIVNGIILLTICIITLYPLLYVVGRSVMTDAERALRPLALFPRTLDWEAYKYILGNGSLIYNGYKITLYRTIVGSGFGLLVEAMFAYAISRKNYPYRKALTIMIAFTLWFQSGLIPNFLLIKSLGLMNTTWVYLFPRLMTAWNILLLRNFFAQVPAELEESARLDGANDVQIFFRIILPLSMPVLATVGLFHAVYHWNEWFTAVLYVHDKAKWPVQVILRQILATATQNDVLEDSMVAVAPPAVSVQMAMVVIVTIPILAVYPFVQKHFTKGVMVGSIKG